MLVLARCRTESPLNLGLSYDQHTASVDNTDLVVGMRPDHGVGLFIWKDEQGRLILGVEFCLLGLLGLILTV